MGVSYSYLLIKGERAKLTSVEFGALLLSLRKGLEKSWPV